MYKRILVPVDTSYGTYEWLKAPIETALDLSRQSMGAIHLVSVVPENLFKGYYPDLYTSDVAGESKKRLRGIRDAMLPSEAPVHLHTKEGGICSQILKTVEEINADLVVMASHGPLARDYVLGSNASYVALHAPCSVFVVRG